jgi:phenylacetate-coenzyme A ligase PaaK-like adenylate-forming protein
VIFEPELETMPRERLRAVQTERLRALVTYVKERVPLYRERLADIEPGDIASLDDLRHLPSPTRTTCETRIRSASSPYRARRPFASMLLRGRRAS